jgi:threonine synthase
VRRGILFRYGARLPLTEKTPRLSLGEGDTPLVSAPTLARELGCERLLLKCEGMNPTGSFKDRGMVLAVAKAVEAGMRNAVCASTGNTSASAAAYCAAAGLGCRVVVPAGKVALGKLSQALAHGARVIVLQGNFDAALRAVRALAERLPIALVNSVNPFRLEGQKTGAFEVIDQLQDELQGELRDELRGELGARGGVPHGLALPVGNAGNISAWWKGFTEHAARERAAGRAAPLPVLYGIQAEGAAPLVRGAPVAHPETVATAIRIGHPASWDLAVQAREQSGGLFAAVSDQELLAAWQRLPREAGVFCEPASAAPVAGLLKLARQEPGRFRGQTLVAVLTGHGLKDPQLAIDRAPPLPAPVPDTPEALAEALA